MDPPAQDERVESLRAKTGFERSEVPVHDLGQGEAAPEAPDALERLDADHRDPAARLDLALRLVPLHVGEPRIDAVVPVALSEATGDQAGRRMRLQVAQGLPTPFGLELAVAIHELNVPDVGVELAQTREALVASPSGSERLPGIQLEDLDAIACGAFGMNRLTSRLGRGPRSPARARTKKLWRAGTRWTSSGTIRVVGSSTRRTFSIG